MRKRRADEAPSTASITENLPKKRTSFWQVIFIVVPLVFCWMLLKVTPAEPRVLVIGSGLAGIQAAATLKDVMPYVEVVVAEKYSSFGGNSAKATSGVNAAGTRWQKQLGIENDVEAFREDVLRSGRGLADPSLVDILVEGSAATIEHIVDVWGLPLTDVVRLGGATNPRTHRFPDGRPLGLSLVRTGMERLESLGVEMKLGGEVLDFQPLVTGKVETKIVTGGEIRFEEWDAVIIASGGFVASREMVGRFATELRDFPVTNGEFSVGNILETGLEKGLFNGRHLDKVQLHPTGFVKFADPCEHKKFLCPEFFRGRGALLIDILTGKRFVDELETRDIVSAAINNLQSSLPQLIKYEAVSFPDEQICANNRIAGILIGTKEAESIGDKTLAFYQSQGMLRSHDSLMSVSKTYGIPINGLEASAQNIEAPFYFGLVTPSLHYSVGGVSVDLRGRAAFLKGDAMGSSGIPTVFVAGEALGGLHGANRLGGNGCLDSLVFGRWAAENVVLQLETRPRSLVLRGGRESVIAGSSSFFQILLSNERSIDVVLYDQEGVKITGKLFAPENGVAKFQTDDVLLKPWQRLRIG